ncbi:uncharacterized protein LOC142972536 [Anticarsia gemmatalis]|uniref:uncharacterized protein LOC142972536 n=1 Tax=Anticarsia gemmatalis TaxID=129554 RepID=UPI003F75926A
MLLAITCLFATVAAGPVLYDYDQRQDGKLNVQADISNIMFLVAVPKKLPLSIFDLFSKSDKHDDGEHEIQERADVRVMEAFVEPSTPYRVEIGSDSRSEGDGRAVEVVIAGRRRQEPDQIESEEQDELKLLGATENCGPERVRDSVTLMCKNKEPVDVIAKPDEQTEQKDNKVQSQPTPEVVPS